jgi:hypothetical protein
MSGACGQRPGRLVQGETGSANRRILGAVPDDEDRPLDASSAADDSWTDLVIPDDIRELADDIAAYRRELREARRARWTRHLVSPRASGPVLALTLASLLAGLVAVLLTVMAPHVVDRPPSAKPLAHPSVADGKLGGLLPAVMLTGPAGQVSTRSATLRPAVYALVPTGCACRTLLDGLAGAAYSENLPLAVVVPAASDPSTAAAVSSLDRGDAALYLDPSAALTTSVGATGVTIVVVDRDGTIYDVERNISNATATSLDAALQTMLLPTT